MEKERSAVNDELADKMVEASSCKSPSWMRFLLASYAICKVLRICLSVPFRYFVPDKEEREFIKISTAASCSDIQHLTIATRLALSASSAIVIVIVSRLSVFITQTSTSSSRVLSTTSKWLRKLLDWSLLTLALPIAWLLNSSVAPVGFAQDSIIKLISSAGDARTPVSVAQNIKLAGHIISSENLQEGCDGPIMGQMWCQTPDTPSARMDRLSANLRAIEQLMGDAEINNDNTWKWSNETSQCKRVIQSDNSDQTLGSVTLVTNLTQTPPLLSLGIRRPEVEIHPLEWPTELHFPASSRSGPPPSVLGHNIEIRWNADFSLHEHWWPPIRDIEPIEVLGCAYEEIKPQCSQALLLFPYLSALSCLDFILRILLGLIIIKAWRYRSQVHVTSFIPWRLGRRVPGPEADAKRPPRRLHRTVMRWILQTAKQITRLLCWALVALELFNVLRIFRISTASSFLPWGDYTHRPLNNKEFAEMTPTRSTKLDHETLRNCFLLIFLSIHCLRVGWTSASSSLVTLPSFPSDAGRATKEFSSLSLAENPAGQGVLFRSKLFLPQRAVLTFLTSGSPRASSILLTSAFMIHYVLSSILDGLESTPGSLLLGRTHCRQWDDFECPYEAALHMGHHLRTIMTHLVILAMFSWATRRSDSMWGLFTFTTLAIWCLGFMFDTKMVRINNADGQYGRFFIGYTTDERITPLVLILGLIHMNLWKHP